MLFLMKSDDSTLPPRPDSRYTTPIRTANVAVSIVSTHPSS
jgi:hypothetical protein